MTESRSDLDWYSLFDGLCVAQGHHDSAVLASRFCQLSGKDGSQAYDAAVKSLNNWRTGAHLPTRRNFRILTTLLEIDALDPETRSLWERGYEAAQRRKSTPEPAEVAEVHSRRRGWRLPALVGGAVTLVVLAAVYLGGFLGSTSEVSRAESGPAAPSQIGWGKIDMAGATVHWLQFARLRVGESAIVHGKRGNNCGEPPPSWEAVRNELPAVAIGEWYDGGVGMRNSRACGGALTPARAVGFLATKKGVEMMMLYDDPITISVE